MVLFPSESLAFLRWFMSIRLGLQCCVLALGVAIIIFFSVAFAQSPGLELPEAESTVTSYVDDGALDELFLRLAEAPDAATAMPIAQNIWQIWLNPNVPELADLMEEAAASARLGDISYAIRIFSAVIDKYPSYAEGWNQRATMYFLVGNYPASFDDVEEVLAREPRHFGALSGKAVMHFRLGERTEALQAIIEALRYHPYLPARAMFEELLAPPTNT